MYWPPWWWPFSFPIFVIDILFRPAVVSLRGRTLIDVWVMIRLMVACWTRLPVLAHIRTRLAVVTPYAHNLVLWRSVIVVVRCWGPTGFVVTVVSWRREVMSTILDGHVFTWCGPGRWVEMPLG